MQPEIFMADTEQTVETAQSAEDKKHNYEKISKKISKMWALQFWAALGQNVFWQIGRNLQV